MNLIYPVRLSIQDMINVKTYNPELYDIQLVIDQHAFSIYECVQSNIGRNNYLVDSSSMIAFFNDLNLMGKLRGNKFSISQLGKHDYKKFPYIHIYKTALGNTVTTQTDKVGLYLNTYYVLIK